MQNAIAAGFQPVTMDQEAFDFAFSKREQRTIKQGRFKFKDEWWVNDETCKLGAGDVVDIHIPLRSGTDRVFVVHNGKLKGPAKVDTPYHPLDRAGAIEGDRRRKLQAQAIRDLKTDLDKSIDPLTELLKNVNSSPLVAKPGAIVRLTNQMATDNSKNDDDARRASIEDLLRGANCTDEASRMAGGK